MKNETNPAYNADILVVDDSHNNLRLLSELLVGHGYYVRPVLFRHPISNFSV